MAATEGIALRVCSSLSISFTNTFYRIKMHFLTTSKYFLCTKMAAGIANLRSTTEKERKNIKRHAVSSQSNKFYLKSVAVDK